MALQWIFTRITPLWLIVSTNPLLKSTSKNPQQHSQSAYQSIIWVGDTVTWFYRIDDRGDIAIFSELVGNGFQVVGVVVIDRVDCQHMATAFLYLIARGAAFNLLML